MLYPDDLPLKIDKMFYDNYKMVYPEKQKKLKKRKKPRMGDYIQQDYYSCLLEDYEKEQKKSRNRQERFIY